MSPSYVQGKGEDLYRRSVYSVWKRTAPLPNMMAFDTTTREICTITRSRTNTPLQALVLLNDVQFVEAAKNMAVELLKANQEPATAIETAWQRATGQVINSEEKTVLAQLLDEQTAYFTKEPERTDKLLASGETGVPKDVDKIKAAAMTVVCQAILNADATVWKR